MPSDDRIWTVECDETGEVDPDELVGAFVECAGIVRRIGGAFTIAARRRQGEPGVYLTEAVVIGWKAHLPMSKRRRQQREELEEAQATEAEHMADVRHREEAGDLSDEELLEAAPEPVGAE